MDYKKKFQESQAESLWELIRKQKEKTFHYLPKWEEKGLGGISAKDRWENNFSKTKWNS